MAEKRLKRERLSEPYTRVSVEVLRDGGHPASVVAYEDVVQCLGVETVFGCRLHHDAVELGKAVEVAGITSAHVAGKRAEYVGGDMPLRLHRAASTSTMNCGYLVANVV